MEPLLNQKDAVEKHRRLTPPPVDVVAGILNVLAVHAVVVVLPNLAVDVGVVLVLIVYAKMEMLLARLTVVSAQEILRTNLLISNFYISGSCFV